MGGRVWKLLRGEFVLFGDHFWREFGQIWSGLDALFGNEGLVEEKVWKLAQNGRGKVLMPGFTFFAERIIFFRWLRLTLTNEVL